MGRTDDDVVTRATVAPASAGAPVDEDQAAREDHRDNMPIEPVLVVDEWPADEAGYGYGV